MDVEFHSSFRILRRKRRHSLNYNVCVHNILCLLMWLLHKFLMYLDMGFWVKQLLL
uniref:Uncharacterized protein n=1 Tax=Rhizophora mucronata TaxID=61149 RepID=A0A2P2Q2K7_RHIMU